MAESNLVTSFLSIVTLLVLVVKCGFQSLNFKCVSFFISSRQLKWYHMLGHVYLQLTLHAIEPIGQIIFA